MMKRGWVRSAVVGAAAILALAGQPALLSPLPATAQARDDRVPTVKCSSKDYGYRYCRADTRYGVVMFEQRSRSPCIPGRTWGRDRGGIWVDGGCSAQFALISERDLRALGYVPDEKGWRYVGGPDSFYGDGPDYAGRGTQDGDGLGTGKAVAIGLGVLGLAILLDAADD